MSKKKLIGIIVASVIGIFVVLAIAIPSEPISTPSTTPPPTTAETISTPSTPTGSSTGIVNESLTYITVGATSSLGHSVQYRFNWGDGNYSEWSSSTSATHLWSSPGNYMVQSQGRSSANPDITSGWSGSKSVTINPVPVPTPRPPDVIMITAKELWHEVDLNPVAADLKYQHKTLEVSGEVGTIGQGGYAGVVHVWLDAGFLYSIYCYFDSADEVLPIVEGQEVTIRGTYKKAASFGVDMIHCTLVQY